MNRRRLICGAAALFFAAAPRARSAASPLEDLPLIVSPAHSPGDTMAVLYSGDGGWAAIDRALAAGLTQAGIPVVGWDALRYFWRRRTAEEAARDLGRVIDHYAAAWGRRRVILAGYSFGADVLPAVAVKLSPAQRARLRLMALISADTHGELQFQPLDWLGRSGPGAFSLRPLVAALGDVPTLCVYGDRETESGCPTFEGGSVRTARLVGDHHFDGRYDQVVAAILRGAAP